MLEPLEDEKLAKAVGKHYHILKEFYPDKEYTVSELAVILKKRQSNTSRLVNSLSKLGLVETWKEKRSGRPYKHVKLSGPVREVMENILEVAKTKGEIWRPQPSEVELCLKALEVRGSKETHIAFLSELESILNSGYWDSRLEKFFDRALDNPERYGWELNKLLRDLPKKSGEAYLFFRKEKDKIYSLVKSSGRLSSLALSLFVDISEGKEILDKMEVSLKGEDPERVLAAAQDHGRKLYKKFGVDFKVFLYKALEHKSEPVRQSALSLMKEIS